MTHQIGHLAGQLFASLAMAVALLSGMVLMGMGLSQASGRDGGRVLGVAMASLPFLGALWLAYGIATWRGGFDWLGLGRGTALLVVLLAVAAAVLVNGLAAAIRLEPPSQVPWALLPVRGWLFVPWPLLLLAGAALALWPGLRPAAGGEAAWAWRLPVLVVGAVSLLLCALMLLQWMAHQQQRAVDAQVRQTEEHQERDRWVREQVQAADPQRDLVSLMNQTSRFETPDIRALALQKVHAHPDLTAALATMLRSAWCDQALIFLDSNDPPDAAALAEPVHDGLLMLAGELRRRMRDTHTLRADEFEPEAQRVIAVADKFGALVPDVRNAVQAVRDALDEPRPHPTDLVARRLLDRWLAQHPRPAGR
ncbi:MAG: hypothetical protein HY855_00665 [Burkholderiales bacterium]|nr:hypothetical protein [Burkholderiales bacterium]